jgi:thymidylate synthase
MRKVRKTSIAIVAGLFLLPIAIVAFIALNNPTASDHDRTSKLLKQITDTYSFKYQRRDGTGPAVYMIPHPLRDDISIYGNYTNQDVEEILTVISKIQANRDDKRRIIVSFYSKELDEKSLYEKVEIK